MASAPQTVVLSGAGLEPAGQPVRLLNIPAGYEVSTDMDPTWRTSSHSSLEFPVGHLDHLKVKLLEEPRHILMKIF